MRCAVLKLLVVGRQVQCSRLSMLCYALISPFCLFKIRNFSISSVASFPYSPLWFILTSPKCVSTVKFIRWLFWQHSFGHNSYTTGREIRKCTGGRGVRARGSPMNDQWDSFPWPQYVIRSAFEKLISLIKRLVSTFLCYYCVLSVKPYKFCWL
jgi:hypothetical protein